MTGAQLVGFVDNVIQRVAAAFRAAGKRARSWTDSPERVVSAGKRWTVFIAFLSGPGALVFYFLFVRPFEIASPPAWWVIRTQLYAAFMLLIMGCGFMDVLGFCLPKLVRGLEWLDEKVGRRFRTAKSTSI